MQLQYRFEPTPILKPLNYTNAFVALGSCFAANIGSRLQQYQIKTCVNPCGIVFNPINLAQHIQLSFSENPNFESLLFQHQEVWLSWLHHGSFSSLSKENLIQQLTVAHQELKEALLGAEVLLLTFGNAWIYEHIPTKIQVANCHKVPANNFQKHLVQPTTIANTICESLTLVKQHNPKLKVITSISPVKYLRWGAHQNNLGKSSLFLALNQIQNQLPGIDYFPAFEILNDELRDYRFYEQDFAHPNTLAIDYIWEIFKRYAFDEATLQYLKELQHLQAQQAHRLLHPESVASLKFKEQLKQQEASFKLKYPHCVF